MSSHVGPSTSSTNPLPARRPKAVVRILRRPPLESSSLSLSSSIYHSVSQSLSDASESEKTQTPTSNVSHSNSNSATMGQQGVKNTADEWRSKEKGKMNNGKSTQQTNSTESKNELSGNISRTQRRWETPHLQSQLLPTASIAVTTKLASAATKSLSSDSSVSSLISSTPAATPKTHEESAPTLSPSAAALSAVNVRRSAWAPLPHAVTQTGSQTHEHSGLATSAHSKVDSSAKSSTSSAAAPISRAPKSFAEIIFEQQSQRDPAFVGTTEESAKELEAKHEQRMSSEAKESEEVLVSHKKKRKRKKKKAATDSSSSSSISANNPSSSKSKSGNHASPLTLASLIDFAALQVTPPAKNMAGQSKAQDESKTLQGLPSSEKTKLKRANSSTATHAAAGVSNSISSEIAPTTVLPTSTSAAAAPSLDKPAFSAAVSKPMREKISKKDKASSHTLSSADKSSMSAAGSATSTESSTSPTAAKYKPTTMRKRIDADLLVQFIHNSILHPIIQSIVGVSTRDPQQQEQQLEQQKEVRRRVRQMKKNAKKAKYRKEMGNDSGDESKEEDNNNQKEETEDQMEDDETILKHVNEDEIKQDDATEEKIDTNASAAASASGFEDGLHAQPLGPNAFLATSTPSASSAPVTGSSSSSDVSADGTDILDELTFHAEHAAALKESALQSNAEAIVWHDFLLRHHGFQPHLIPPLVPLLPATSNSVIKLSSSFFACSPIYRKHCRQMVKKSIDRQAFRIVRGVQLLQQKMKEKDAAKAKIRRRFVAGLREVLKGIKADRVRALFVARNIQQSSSLDYLVDEILTLCASRPKIFMCFCCKRRDLGRAIQSPLRVSVIGFIDFSGLNEEMKTLQALVLSSREEFAMFHEDSLCLSPLSASFIYSTSSTSSSSVFHSITESVTKMNEKLSLMRTEKEEKLKKKEEEKEEQIRKLLEEKHKWLEERRRKAREKERLKREKEKERLEEKKREDGGKKEKKLKDKEKNHKEKEKEKDTEEKDKDKTKEKEGKDDKKKAKAAVGKDTAKEKKKKK